jgi:hypothetical protein
MIAEDTTQEVITWVDPAPDSSIKVGELQEICVGIDPYPLLELGDDLYEVTNIELLIDGYEGLAKGPYHITVDLSSELRDDTGQIIAMGSAADTVCWTEPKLTTGRHTALVRVWSTSGKKEFSREWEFDLVE